MSSAMKYLGVVVLVCIHSNTVHQSIFPSKVQVRSFGTGRSRTVHYPEDLEPAGRKLRLRTTGVNRGGRPLRSLQAQALMGRRRRASQQRVP
ncbi:hypothetical protein K437DRAFT_162395 [Tilletiaria anomala UBC 951]|uniref:Uncharacterized protein n=1 Tax=Tilletiaria anomala (strain ATCC 24038 / CBS 436.72 / UBC 951) TaxID=1037660 RepID=A0A066WFZ3_TILAU|nr:uncharacterized protein K437DRAFT_162395 [Tilletiaria anomala UBC 951]KDN52716.1 hypothetical protein K437DRAFT_162395 [Tilletiaria anomala UBC 951]